MLYYKKLHCGVEEVFNFFYAPPSPLVSAHLIYSDEKHEKKTAKKEVMETKADMKA